MLFQTFVLCHFSSECFWIICMCICVYSPNVVCWYERLFVSWAGASFWAPKRRDTHTYTEKDPMSKEVENMLLKARSLRARSFVCPAVSACPWRFCRDLGNCRALRVAVPKTPASSMDENCLMRTNTTLHLSGLVARSFWWAPYGPNDKESTILWSRMLNSYSLVYLAYASK